ncbi:MAG: serine acetyltransferase [Nitrospirae bacterium]|nr:serine acetyltransferase [Nitrospirota bacterium]
MAEKKTLLEEIQSDLHTNGIKLTFSPLRLFKVILSYRFLPIVMMRLVVNDLFLLSGISRIALNILYHMEIGRNVRIGKSLHLPHPSGIVIATGTQIGDNCAIYHRTTFAEKGGMHKGPVLGNCCVVGTGTVILGNLHIGDNVKIGPNSVVIYDVPSNTIAFGNPLVLKQVSNAKTAD